MSVKSEDRHNDLGEEVLDETPRRLPLKHSRTPTLREQILLAVRQEKLLADDAIGETEEEADDFEVGEDFEPISPHENDHIPSIKALKAKAKEINDKIADANRRAAVAAHEKTKAEVGKAKSQEPVVNPGADPSPDGGSA